MTATVTLRPWNDAAVKGKTRAALANVLNEAAADGVKIVQAIAPRDTGFMANTMEITQQATPGHLSVSWGNVTAEYTFFVEVGARGRPGRYFLRRSLEQVGASMARRLKGRM